MSSTQNNPAKKKVQKKQKLAQQFYKPKKIKQNPLLDDELDDDDNLDAVLDSDNEQKKQNKQKQNKNKGKQQQQNQEEEKSEDEDQLFEQDKDLNEFQEYLKQQRSQNQQEDDSENDEENEDDDLANLEYQKLLVEQSTGAWIDEDDINIKVDISKVARLRKLRNNEKEKEISGLEYQKRLKKFYSEKLNTSSFYSWAFKDKEYQSDSDFENDDLDENQYAQVMLDKLLKQDQQILKSTNDLESLPQDLIDIEKYGMVRHKDRHDAVIQQIDFHHNSQIFLTAGLDKLVKIYNVKDQKSLYRDKIKLIKSIYLENFPIEGAQFISSRGEILASGLKKHLFTIDLQKDSIEKVSSHLFTNRFDRKLGKFILSKNEKYIALFNKGGYFVMILDANSKQFLFELKITESIASADFSWDGKYIFVLGSAGSIFQYCMQKRAIFDVIQDESVQTRIIKCGKGQVATGSFSGIVNVYLENSIENTLIPKPIKELQNLTTEISTLEFNHSGELMFFGTRWKKNQARLAHIPSYGVYQNWPNFKTHFSFVSAASFSYDNKFMAIGNQNGQVSLYNLNHFNGSKNIGLLA